MTTSAAVALTFPGMPILEQTPGILRTLLAAAAREDLDWQPSPERWSISMVLAHLAEVEVKAFRNRFTAMAENDNAYLPSYDQLALFRSRTRFEAFVELDTFEQRRLAWLKSLPASVANRTGRHEELGPLTFGQLLHEFATFVRRSSCTDLARSIRKWELSAVLQGQPLTPATTLAWTRRPQ